MEHLSPEALSRMYDELAGLTSTRSVLAMLASRLAQETPSWVSIWGLEAEQPALLSEPRPDAPFCAPSLQDALRDAFRSAESHDLVCDAGANHAMRERHHALLLPLAVRGEVQAVVVLEQQAPYGSHARNMLLLFAKAVAGLLVQMKERERAAATAKLAEALPGQNATEACHAALEHLRRFTRAQSVTLLDYRDATLHPSRLVDSPSGAPRNWSPEVIDSFRMGKATLDDDFMLFPVAGRNRARRALWASFGDRGWVRADPILVQMVARLLGSALERFETQAQMASHLRLQRELLSVPPEGLYLPLLREAVRLVPGAQTGSLLVRLDDHFHYRAWVGFDGTELRDVSFLLSDTRDVWYGLDEAAWSAGVPRVLSQGSMLQQGAGYRVRNVPIAACLPSTDRLQANLCVPILYQGEVFAALNLDSTCDPDAFGPDSVDAARAFAAQAAVLIYHARQRQMIEDAARTDALTGLPNRRAFNETLMRAVRGASRSLQPVSMLVLDLSGFKGVNDRLGHAAGDEVLIAVARALQGQLRGEDQVFRWGGDEFAVLLPSTDEHGAVQIAGRLAGAVLALSSAEMTLRANIGVATASGEALCGEALLRQADAAMYRAKASGQPYSVSR